jgi:uncharacterized membrane protein YkvA (DUF1232 family)
MSHGTQEPPLEPPEERRDPEIAWPDLSQIVAPEADEEASRRALDETHPPLPSTGLLSFYDRLRERVLQWVEKRGGRIPEAAVEAVLLVPDVFILLVRLALDREVPKPTRALIAGALAYFVLPTDLFPEALFGAGGFLEDLVLASAVLAQAFGGELEPYAQKHWSGSHELKKVVGDLTQTAHVLLGENLYGRLKRLLARRGVDLPRDGE